MSIIGDTAEYMKSGGVPIERWAEDEKGRYAFRCTIHEQTFWVVARKYRPKKHIGAMKRVLERARDQDAQILVRIGSPDIQQLLVFDAEAWLQYGQDNTERRSREFRGETWIDIPTDWGVELEEFVEGWKEPQTQPETDEASPADLTEF